MNDKVPGESTGPDRKKLLWLLKIILSVGALIACFYLIDLQRLLELLRAADLQLLAWMPVLVVIQTVIGAGRFKILFDPLRKLPIFEHIRQYFVASYFNLLLPSSIGGDAVRIFMLGRKGASKSKAAIYIFSERLMGLYSLIGLAFVAALSITLSDQTQNVLYALLVFVLFSFVGIVLVVTLSRNWNQYHINHFREAAHLLWRHQARLFTAILVSFVYQTFTISFTLLVAAALAIEISWLYIFALVPLIWLVTFLPISLGGVGVREISFIGLFVEVGLHAEEAILLSLGTYAAMVIGGILGGLWSTHTSLRSLRAENETL